MPYPVTGVRGVAIRVRIAIALLVGALVALTIDAYLRFWARVRYRHDPRGKRAAFDAATRVWGRIMFVTARWCVGLDIRVEGRVPAEGRFLVVANHQSSLDIPLLIATLHRLRPKFVALERLRFGTPTVSLLLREGGGAFVGKTNPARDLAGLARFAAGLAEFDESAVIFPAGGLQRDRDAPAFHLAGIEVLRRGARLPILPVAIEGWREAPSIGHLAHIAGGRVTMRILDPIPWNPDEPDPRASLRRLEDLIYGHVAEMRGVPAPAAATPVPVEA